jgi:hypothetical protein
MAGYRERAVPIWEQGIQGQARLPKLRRKGISEGRRVDSTGGELIRSVGGWGTVKKQRKLGIRLKGDERALGDTGIVEENACQGQ